MIFQKGDQFKQLVLFFLSERNYMPDNIEDLIPRSNSSNTNAIKKDIPSQKPGVVEVERRTDE